MLVKNPTTGVVCALLNYIRRIKDLRLNAQVVIKTVNVVISRCCFAEDTTDFFISACRTNSTLIFLRPIKFSIDGVVVAVPVVDAKAP